MTLPAPRIIVIDDNQDHLKGLSDGLNRHGVACLPVHFTGDDTEIPKCPQVRVVFADLHLNEAGAATDNARHFTVIGGLIEQTIVPSGPYAIVLWTRYADQAEGLRTFLEERLMGVPKPFAVVALDKNLHLNADNTVRDIGALVAAIANVLGRQPQLAALLNWEERVLGASAATLSAVIDLAITGVEPNDRDQAIGRLLFRFALEAVGEGNVESDRFRAVNEALLPILADRIASLRSDGDAQLWEAALHGQSADSGMKIEEAAKLNRFLHVADATGASPAERGAVARLPDATLGEFERAFGMTPVAAARTQFACAGFVENDPRFRWLLVQVQAVCDFAQRRPGPLPYVLGLEMPMAPAPLPRNAPAALVECPAFELAGAARALRVNTRFQVTLSPTAAAAMVLEYRLREPLINEIAYGLHSYGARPGIISFRESKPKAIQPVAKVDPQQDVREGVARARTQNDRSK
jgi:hypothetical protein